MKKRVLIMTAWYLPGVKAGGPIQSIKNLVDNLSDQIDFYILTSDRDLGDTEPYQDIDKNSWGKVGNANVYYTDTSKLSFKDIAEILNGVEYDVLYLNSFFSYKYTIVPLLLRKFKKITDKPIVLAPRGEFSKGALELKSIKKKLYIRLAKLVNLYGDINWHATNDIEKSNIKNTLSKNLNIKVVSNLTPNYKNINESKDIIKNAGELKAVYISRIHPMKNLLQVLEILKNINENIDLSIYGPIEDEKYWGKCKNLINEMPNNITIKYKGLLPNERVYDVHQEHHVFLLLTLGENFGHAISEALVAGSPVIISDRTPWSNLHVEGVGWDLPLENDTVIADKIKYFIALDNYEYKNMSQRAFEYARKKSNPIKNIDSYSRMFSN